MTISNALQFSPNRAAQTPLYQQLVDHVKSAIASGILRQGESLPTTRALAAELSCNRNTVTKAYRQLQLEGWIASHIGRGTVVKRGSSAMSETTTNGDKAVSWSHLLSRSARQLPDFSCWNVNGVKGDIWLSRMQPSADLLPMQRFSECLQTVLARNDAENFLYALPTGVPRLREQIMQELKRYGIATENQEVIVTTGTSQAIDLVLRALIEPGDKVFIEDPTYYGGLQLIRFAGAHLVPLPSDEQGPDLKRLADNALAGVKAAYFIPNYRNPTARTISAERRQAMAQWANRHGLVMIEDDYGYELGLDGPTPPSLKSFAPENVIYISSYSKRLIPGLRVGYLVVPKGPLAEKLMSIKRMVDLGNAGLVQNALAEFMERGYLQAHLECVIPQYRRRRDVMQAMLTQEMPQEVQWQPPAGGLFFWLTLPNGFPVDTLIHKCAEQHLQISGGQVWSATDSALSGVRLTFCAEPAARLESGIKILGAVLREMLGRTQRQRPMENIVV